MASRSTGLIVLLVASTAVVWFLARRGPGPGPEMSSPPGVRVPDESAAADVSIVARPDLARPGDAARAGDEHDSRPVHGASSLDDVSREAAPRPREPKVHEGVVVRVLYSDGMPAPGARVLLTDLDPGPDDRSTFWHRRSEEGLFTESLGRCWVRDVPADADLVVLSAGYLPAEIRDFDDWCAAHPGEEAVVRLEGEPLAIGGRVFDANGRPASGWRVRFDSTPALRNHSVEDLIQFSGAAKSRSCAATDEDGYFEIGNLADREYTLVAIAADDSDYAFATGVRAGTDGIILRTRPDGFREVRGTVRGWNGSPVGGATVTTTLKTSWNSGWSSSSRSETDEHGRFVLERVSRFLTTISVRGARVRSGRGTCVVYGHEVELDPADWSDEVAIVVERLAPVRVELAGHIELPLDMCGVDAEGSWRYLNRVDENGVMTGGGGWLKVETRQTEVRLLRESAIRLEFHRPDGRYLSPVHEVDIALNPDVECNVVRVGF